MAKEITFNLDDRKLREINRDVREMGGEIAQTLARYVEFKWKAAQGTGAKGAIYKRGSRTHTASAPGAPPAVDTGTYRNSIHSYPLSGDTWGVSDGVGYGVMLEFGTRKMAARPSLQPAMDDMQRNVVGLVRGVTDRKLK